MKLELGKFPVSAVREGSNTGYRDGVLSLDTESLTRLVLENPAIVHARIEIARPGDSVRVVGYRDVVAPQIKVDGPGVAYPGICGRPADFAGRGRTHRIDGVGVVNLADTEAPPGGTVEKRTHGFDTLFDMSGPSASLIPYSQLNNICLVLHTDRNLSESARAWAAEAATLRVSDAIAETVRGETPAEVQTFESPESDSDLPRVVYISCHGSPEHYADAVRAYGTSIYGLSRLNAPWLLNPNEWLDGAVAGRDSWILVNNPVIMDLYSRHNRDLIFAGCIAIRTRWSQQVEKNVTSNQAAKIAQQVGATGAGVTWDAGGNDFMEVIRTVQACEQIGVNAVFLTFEEHPDNGSPLLEPLPDARAIITTGWGRNELMSEASIPEYDEPLPAVDKVIGRQSIMANQNALSGQVNSRSELPTYMWVDRYGSTSWSAFDY